MMSRSSPGMVENKGHPDWTAGGWLQESSSEDCGASVVIIVIAV